MLKYSPHRFGRGLGREYCEAYSLEYWREGMAEGHFRRYRDRAGREVREKKDSISHKRGQRGNSNQVFFWPCVWGKAMKVGGVCLG